MATLEVLTPVTGGDKTRCLCEALTPGPLFGTCEEGGGVKDDGITSWEAGWSSFDSILNDCPVPAPAPKVDVGASVEGSEAKLCCDGSIGVVGASLSLTVMTRPATVGSVVAILNYMDLL